MREVFDEMLSLLAGSILTIALLIGGYLIFANLYHQKDTSYEYNINLMESPSYQSYVKMVDEAKELIESFDYNQIGGGDQRLYYSIIGIALQRCTTYMTTDKYYSSGNVKTIKQVDNYHYYKEFNSNIYGKCLNNEILPLEAKIKLLDYDKKSDYYANDFIDLSVEGIRANNEYLKKITISNSSYSYITNETRRTLQDPTESTFSQVMNNYLQAAKIVNAIANHYAEEVKGVR